MTNPKSHTVPMAFLDKLYIILDHMYLEMEQVIFTRDMTAFAPGANARQM